MTLMRIDALIAFAIDAETLLRNNFRNKAG